jgi:hypothetical protein
MERFCPMVKVSAPSGELFSKERGVCHVAIGGARDIFVGGLTALWMTPLSYHSSQTLLK